MPEPALSFVSCVSRRAQYDECVAGSLPPGVELLPVDNANNERSAAAALNFGWAQARAPVIVLCHQDVVFPRGWVDRLHAQLEDVSRRSPNWAVAGVFGRRARQFLGHVDDRYGVRCLGELPTPVETLDECCIVVRRELPLRFDEGLGGYHLYGVDLCLQALEAGLDNWALDCPVKHLGAGTKDETYYQIRRALERKWRWRRLWVRRRIPAKLWGPCGPIHFGLHYALKPWR
jgi:hypothetical protein